MLEERIAKDYVQAMKDRDHVRSSTLNFLRADLKNVRIDKRADHLEDGDVVAVIKKQIKQRQDSIDLYGQGGRQDLVEKESAEMAVLKGYLPQEISEEELKVFVQEAVHETGAQSMKDMGKVMKALFVKVQGRADNKLVSAMVQKVLTPS
ncbi:MAG: hypothetical protein A3G91_05050 [Omnitrophica WOR_2 bacterium RIFCSPLOWO2_12_FULL_50_9]|nr:MAG: hypothetical protein A3D87_06770 [Omnitrophica WOR_2 bacterium RIFCSPHIGHO2_02_FULL_50_17]OGX42887.1 MAG: hypothetical protein A3G91_05050 [Omnitrophica WOR_2 bacterium RIFCSPLOWO2_12_FULL_50_9]